MAALCRAESQLQRLKAVLALTVMPVRAGPPAQSGMWQKSNALFASGNIRGNALMDNFLRSRLEVVSCWSLVVSF